jgi:tRNA pseudouridine55 synthase
MNKLLLINKPAEWTSFDVVAKIRGLIRQSSQIDSSESRKIKVGHAGTLDPFATGLLIILTGNLTKKQSEFMKLDKEYLATLKLGFKSSTGDPEGKITKSQNPNLNIPTKTQIKKILEKFLGETEQTPPAYSAIKVNGKRAYDLARKGESVQLKSRKINVYNLELIDYDWPELTLKVKCSSGTYIRSLAEDIGKKLGTDAYTTALRRTKIGTYDIEDAVEIDKLSLT